YMAERKNQRARWVGALQKAPIPIRVIDGLDDPVSGAHMVERYRALVAQPDVVELPGIGHYPQVEAPGRVLVALRDWSPFLAGEARA
ncbi:MAG: alpha/beta fold hydrolase, partial [Algiphilus sp.]